MITVSEKLRIVNGQAPQPGSLNWAEEEKEINIRHDNSELPDAMGGNFWRMVWKRIENSDHRSDASAQMREMALEPPRDYVVETDNQTRARAS